MNKILLLALTLLVSVSVYAAFNQKESEQLRSINKLYKEQLYHAEKQIQIKKDKVINLFPERSSYFIKMYHSWKKFVIDKCQFDEFETLDRDSEVSSISKCKFTETKKFNNYLDMILSMP